MQIKLPLLLIIEMIRLQLVLLSSIIISTQLVKVKERYDS